MMRAATQCITIMVQKMWRFIPGAENRPLSAMMGFRNDTSRAMLARIQ
jgi:hypothetical protein